MTDKKYNRVLLIVLIVVGILALGLLIFWGVSIYKRYYSAKEANNVIEQAETYYADDPGEQTAPVNSIEVNITDLDSADSDSTSVKKQTYKGYALAGYIEIPSIKLSPEKMPILERYTSSGIEVSPAIIYGPGLNVAGNTVIEGHNYRNGTHFSNISEIKINDTIYVTDLYNGHNRIKYTVYNVYETAAEDKGDALYRDTAGKREITLSTCYGDNNNDSRTIIWARESE